MPEGIKRLDMSEILTFEEIIQLVKNAASLGINKIKITGGEPLVRRDVAKLIGQIKAVEGIEKLTLTTNGILLEEKLDELIEAGIDGVNISLDCYNNEDYEKLTGFDEFSTVLSAINAAYEKGIKTKVNVVAMREFADDYRQLVLLAREKAIDIRFIETMPIGHGKKSDFISNDEVRSFIESVYGPMMNDDNVHGNGPAIYYKIQGFKGSIGFISPINNKFCKKCNRIRLTSTGYLKGCLCYENGADLRNILRDDTTVEVMNERLLETMKMVIENKPLEHCFNDYSKITEGGLMSDIGG